MKAQIKSTEKELPPAIAWNFLDNLDEGVIIAETGGAVLYFNQAAKTLLGFRQTMLSLAEVIKPIAPDEAWQAMTSSNVETRFTTNNTPPLNIKSFPYPGYDKGLIQIVVSPSNTTDDRVNRILNRNRENEVLLEAYRAISGILEKNTVLTVMGEQMQSVLNADGYTIYEWERANNTLVIQKEYVKSSPGESLPSGTVSMLEKIPSAPKVLATQQPYVTQVDRNDPELLQRPWLANESHFTSITIPITLSDETFGLIELIFRGKQTISADKLRLLVALSNQASTTLETALIFEDTYEREQFYNALGRVSLAMNFTLDRQTVLNLIGSESLRIFSVDGAYIWQLDGEHLIGSAAAGLGEEDWIGTSVPLADTTSFATSIARTGEATFINHINPQKRALFRLPRKEQIKAVLGVPFEQEGNIIGVLVLVDSSKPDRFREKDATLASIFGVQVAIALQNAKLFGELRLFNEELDRRVAERTQALHEESNRVKMLLRITSELSASLDQDRVLNRALHLVNEVVDATEGAILLINQETDELDFRAKLGSEPTPLYIGVPSGLRPDAGLAGWMIENRSAVIVHDTHEDPRWVDLPKSRDHRSVLGVPLIANDEVIGVLMLFHSESAAFTMHQLDLVEAAAIQVANAISNASLYLLIRDQAESLGTMLLGEQIETAKSQSILESIADGVLVTDANSKITLANVAASSILDISREQLNGKLINELLGLYRHAGESWVTTIEDWAANADLIEQGTFLADELRIEGKVVSIHLSPVLAGNQFFGTVSIFRDITKDVEVDRLKSEFVSTVSHELRTPMTSIKGYVDLLLLGVAGEMTKTQNRYLQIIKNNADRLHMLVNDLLDISSVETGETVLDKRPVDIAKIVEQVVEGHLRGRIQHENKNMNVQIEMAPSLPLVNADQARITQVLTNLLDNALNYTPEYGEIRIHAYKENSSVAVRISDSGIGIAEEIRPKIFDRFFRSEDKAVQNVSGTGLGLSIVHNFVEMHGGRLDVHSSIGKGSTFTFTLPVVPENGGPA